MLTPDWIDAGALGVLAMLVIGGLYLGYKLLNKIIDYITAMTDSYRNRANALTETVLELTESQVASNLANVHAIEKLHGRINSHDVTSTALQTDALAEVGKGMNKLCSRIDHHEERSCERQEKLISAVEDLAKGARENDEA